MNLKKILKFLPSFLIAYIVLTAAIYLLVILLAPPKEKEFKPQKEIVATNNSSKEDEILGDIGNIEDIEDIETDNSTYAEDASSEENEESENQEEEDSYAESTPSTSSYVSSTYSGATNSAYRLCEVLATAAEKAYDAGYSGANCFYLSREVARELYIRYPYFSSAIRSLAAYIGSVCVLGALDRRVGNYRAYSIRNRIYNTCLAKVGW